MKTQLTQQDVDNFIKSNFVKSNFYPGKLIKLNTSAYMSEKNAATFAAFFLSNRFEFQKGLLSWLLERSFKNLGYADEKQCFELSLNFMHWPFFEAQFKDSNIVLERDIMQRFKDSFAYEKHNKKTFYERLNQWVAENNYNINVKGWPVRKIYVSK